MYHQAVSAMNMVLESSFRYSAGMTQWTDAQLLRLQKNWVAGTKAALKLNPSAASCPFTLPAVKGGTPIRQPHAVLLQALGSHI